MGLEKVPERGYIDDVLQIHGRRSSNTWTEERGIGKIHGDSQTLARNPSVLLTTPLATSESSLFLLFLYL